MRHHFVGVTKMVRHIPLICAALLLSGCGATLFGPEPGLTDISVRTPAGLAFDYESGKEAALVTGNYRTADGTEVTFRVEGLEAFEGQRILMEMQARQIDALSNMVELMKSLAAAYASGGLIPPKPPAPPVGPP